MVYILAKFIHWILDFVRLVQSTPKNLHSEFLGDRSGEDVILATRHQVAGNDSESFFDLSFYQIGG